MIKALIIDDEQHCIEALELLVKKYCPGIELLDSCSDGFCGLDTISKHQPGLVFLDIAMPKMNGFEMLNRLERIDFEVIFTTAYDQYAIKAFKVSAVDYLLKPIDRKELAEAVKKANERILLKSGVLLEINEQVAHLLQTIAPPEAPLPQISIPTLTGLEMIKAEDILYVTGDGSYTHVIVKNRSPYLVSKTMKYIENKLQEYPFFYRIHNSSIINLNELKSYVRGVSGYVVMSDGKSLTVSRHRKKAFLKKLEHHK